MSSPILGPARREDRFCLTGSCCTHYTVHPGRNASDASALSRLGLGLDRAVAVGVPIVVSCEMLEIPEPDLSLAKAPEAASDFEWFRATLAGLAQRGGTRSDRGVVERPPTMKIRFRVCLAHSRYSRHETIQPMNQRRPTRMRRLRGVLRAMAADESGSQCAHVAQGHSTARERSVSVSVRRMCFSIRSQVRSTSRLIAASAISRCSSRRSRFASDIRRLIRR